MKLLLNLLLAVLLTACADTNTGSNGTDGSDAVVDPVPLYQLSGNTQKGPCLEDGELVIQPVDADLNQVGTHYMGFTSDNLGSYDIPAEIPELYAEIFFEGECHNEITGGSEVQKLSGIIKVTDTVNNINPLTKMRSTVARWLFNDISSSTTGNIDASMIEAERLILIYLGMPVLDKRFTEMNLENAGIHDAVLALINSMILYGHTEAEQGAYIVRIANGVISGDLALKAEIATTIAVLPLIVIKENLERRYAELGLIMDVPPIWNLGAPAYYADLLERTPYVLSSFNLADNTTCSFGLAGFNTFAVPYVFDVGIETSRYLALNFPSDVELSVWTVGVDGLGNPAPGVKLLDITGLAEIIIADPVKMSYNGFLGDAHGLVGGVQYYLKLRKDTGFSWSKTCAGNRLDTQYVLASDDEGATWIGHANNADRFFYFDGVKGYTTN